MPIAPAPGRAEDVAAADGDAGIVTLAVRRDTAAVSSGTDGDYSNIIVDASGRLWTSVGSLPASTNTLEVVGDVAQDAAIAGNPLSVGGRASAAQPTSMSADGDSVFLWLDLKGSPIVSGYVAQDAAVAGNPVLTGQRASTAIPTAMSADGDSVFSWADRSGATVVTARPTATATLANVASSATSVTILASNTSRKGAVIVNDSTQILYLKFGATASATSFTYQLAAGETLEIPGANILYTGIIDGLWASANGNARVTELA